MVPTHLYADTHTNPDPNHDIHANPYAKTNIHDDAQTDPNDLADNRCTDGDIDAAANDANFHTRGHGNAANTGARDRNSYLDPGANGRGYPHRGADDCRAHRYGYGDIHGDRDAHIRQHRGDHTLSVSTALP